MSEMEEESSEEQVPKKDRSTIGALAFFVVLLVLFFGIQFLNAHPQYLPSEPLIDVIREKARIAKENAPPDGLYTGQSEDEVRRLLGTPTGTATITNRVVFMYYGNILNFVDGKLLPVDDGLLDKIKSDRRRSSGKDSD